MWTRAEELHRHHRAEEQERPALVAVGLAAARRARRARGRRRRPRPSASSTGNIRWKPDSSRVTGCERDLACAPSRLLDVDRRPATSRRSASQPRFAEPLADRRRRRPRARGRRRSMPAPSPASATQETITTPPVPTSGSAACSRRARAPGRPRRGAAPRSAHATAAAAVQRRSCCVATGERLKLGLPAPPAPMLRRLAARSGSSITKVAPCAGLRLDPACARRGARRCRARSRARGPCPARPALVVKNGSKIRVAHLVRRCPGRRPRTRAARRAGVGARADADRARARRPRRRRSSAGS